MTNRPRNLSESRLSAVHSGTPPRLEDIIRPDGNGKRAVGRLGDVTTAERAVVKLDCVLMGQPPEMNSASPTVTAVKPNARFETPVRRLPPSQRHVYMRTVRRATKDRYAFLKRDQLNSECEYCVPILSPSQDLTQKPQKGSQFFAAVTARSLDTSWSRSGTPSCDR